MTSKNIGKGAIKVKNWQNPGLETLDMGETAYGSSGARPDGGFIGNGLIPLLTDEES